MGTALDALTPDQHPQPHQPHHPLPPQQQQHHHQQQPPLNSRRPAAQALPTFELPPPTFKNAPSVRVSTLLTPPAPASTATAPDLAVSYGSPTGYWQGAATGAGSYARPSAWAPTVHPHSRPAATSPAGVVDAGSPAYDMNQLPPFPGASAAAAPPHQSSQVPTMPPGLLASLPNSGPAPPPALPSNDPAYLANKSVSVSAGPTYPGPAPLASPPVYGTYGPLGMPQQQPQPPGGRIGASPHPSSNSTNPSHLNYQRPPWPSYSLPAMNGPVMSNLHNPSGPMSMLGNLPPGLLPTFHSGHMAHLQQLYGGHPPHPGPARPDQERPFKCDQCPQSFNRNHDLKRHKRIHLSVKPFPCTHCDKSFSRKDALKRHILVKGCGKDGDAGKNDRVKEEEK